VVAAAAVLNSNGYTFSPAINNLLAGLSPTAITNGKAGEEGSGAVTFVTDGTIPAFTKSTTYTVGNNAILDYSLGASPTGYDISAVNLFSGWADPGRSTITLANISYSTVAAPGTFIAIAGTGHNYAGGGAANSAVITAPGGVLATGVSAVRFNFGTQQNTYVGYRELEVVGTPTGSGGSVLPGGTAVQIASGASLDLNGVTLQTIGSLADSGGGGGAVINTAASTPVTITIHPTSGSTTFSGTITEGGSANAISLTKSGSGTQVLSGGNSNYSGLTTLANGILNVASLADYGANSSLGNRAADSAGNVGLLFRGGTLQYTGATAQSTNRAIRISTTGEATIDASGSNPAATLSFTAASSPEFLENNGNRTLILTGTNTGANTFGMGITEAGGTTALVKNGVGTWLLSGANTYTGMTAVNNGVLNLTGSLTGGTAISTTGAGAFTQSSTGVISGASSVTLAGTGTSTLGGTNSYSGVTKLEGGILNVASFSDYGVDGGLGNRASSADVSENIGIFFRGGTLQYTGATAQSTNRAIRISTVGGAFIDASGSIPSATLSFTATSSPDFFENPGTRTLTLTGGNTGNNTFGMAIVDQGGNATTLVKNGGGTWLLTGNSNYSGETFINAGALRIATTTALGVGGFNPVTRTIVANNAALELQGGITVDEHFHFVGNGPAGLGGVRSVSGNNTLITTFALDGDSAIGVDADTLTVAAQIYHDVPTAALTKVGNGTLTLSGPVLVDALTTSAGTTNLDAALGTGTSTLNANATTNISVSQKLGALNIGTVTVVALGGGPVAAPGFGATSAFGASVVPEPGSIGLLVTGALGILARRPKRHDRRGNT